jgi:hypothetical protein
MMLSFQGQHTHTTNSQSERGGDVILQGNATKLAKGRVAGKKVTCENESRLKNPTGKYIVDAASNVATWRTKR